MNAVERTRLRLGTTRPQMAQLIRCQPNTRITIFSAKNSEIDDSIMRRLEILDGAYTIWLRELEARIRQYQDKDIDLLTARQTAQLLEISEFHLLQIRLRSHIQATKISEHDIRFAPAAIHELIHFNSRAVTSENKKSRGPLATAFVQWYKKFTKQ